VGIWGMGSENPATSTMVRRLNENLVLSIMRKHKELSRSDIQRLTSLTYPTVSKAIASLLEQGLLIESGEGESRGGRRPRLVRFDADSGLLAGVEVDKSRIRFGGFSLDYQLVAKCTLPLPDTNPETVRSRIVNGVTRIKAEAGEERTLYGVGIGCPGMVHPKTGRIISRSTLRWAEPVDIAEEVSQWLEVPVFIDNDINIAALGEMFTARREELESWAYISVATGVGSGIVLNRQILRGFAGGAGELGHVSVNHKGAVCSCGSRGCLENYISSPAISQRLGIDGDYSECFRILRSRVKAQDAEAVEIYRETVDYLAIAIISILNLLNPFAVIIGGEILDLGQEFLEDLRKEVTRGCGNVLFDCEQLVFSELGADAGLYGGAVFTDQSIFGSPQLGAEL